MSLKIRPYISVAESIMRTAPNLLNTTMPSIIIGTAVDEKDGFEKELDFTTLNSASIANLSTLDSDGKVFKIAGIRPGSTLDVSTLEFGAYELTSQMDFGSKELHFHVKSSTEKHILVLETGDNYVTKDELLDKGFMVGDDVTLEPPSADQKPFTAKVRDFGKDDSGNVLVYLWDEVPYDVDDSNSLKANITKTFKNVKLINSGFIFENVPAFGDSVLIKGPGVFKFNYFVYKPTDTDVFFDNIEISLNELTIPNTTFNKVTAVAKDGELANWFTANRTDIANQIIGVNYNNYESVIGKPTPRNKLGNMLNMVAEEIPGFNLKVYVVKDDTDESYIEALNILATSTKAYQVTCLTDSKNVLDALIGMVKKSSQPEISAYKMGLFSPRKPLYSKKIELSDATITDNGDNTYTIESVSGGFSVTHIQEGDIIIGSEDLKIADDEYYNSVGEPYSSKIVAKVKSVITDKKIIVTPIVSSIKVDDALNGQNIVIIKLNNKTEVANYIKNLAESIKDMHITLIFPDKYIVRGKLVPGYYIAGLIAAVLAHIPPQQGLSNMSFRIIDKVIGSAFYYTDDELDDIASSGVAILTQLSYDSAPYIIRQLTTNMDSLEEMEINKVRCLDYAALEIKDALDGYVGKRNVTKRNVTDVRNAITYKLNHLIKDTDNDLLGSVITSYTINDIDIPENDPEAIVGDIEVTTPTSLNAIRLFVKSKN